MPFTKEKYSITELSTELGITDHTLRFYEKEFELNIPKDSRGRRYYLLPHANILYKIKYMRDEGLEIKAIRKLIELERLNSNNPEYEICLKPRTQNSMNSMNLQGNSLEPQMNSVNPQAHSMSPQMNSVNLQTDLMDPFENSMSPHVNSENSLVNPQLPLQEIPPALTEETVTSLMTEFQRQLQVKLKEYIDTGIMKEFNALKEQIDSNLIKNKLDLQKIIEENLRTILDEMDNEFSETRGILYLLENKKNEKWYKNFWSKKNKEI